MTAVSDYDVRRAHNDDFAALESFLRSVSRQGLADDLFAKEHWIGEVYVARVVAGGEIVGMLEGRIEYGVDRPELLRACRVFNLVVEPALRRRGIGTALMARFVANAGDAGRRSLVLAVDLSEPREGRVAFFEACGMSWVDEEHTLMGADLDRVRQALKPRHG